MKKKVSLIIVDQNGSYEGEATFRGYTCTVTGMNEAEIKERARAVLIEEDEIKETDHIDWDVKWN